MAVYDLEEQEKLDDLKAWWRQWGNTVLGIVIAVCLGLASVQGWRWWQTSRAEHASVLYGGVVAAVTANDVAKAKDAMAQLADRFGGTAYAPRGALLVAKTLFDAGDKDGAKAQLAFVIDQSSEEELKEIARLRLAQVQLDDKQYDDALRTLDAKTDDAFTPIYADLRGDVYLAAGRTADARAAYEAALGKFDANSQYRPYLQAKLDAAGGPSTPAAGAAPGASAAAPVTTVAPATPPAPATTAPASAPAPAK
jgi:predicted negative regulator of RcsB-dependent stress response